MRSGDIITIMHTSGFWILDHHVTHAVGRQWAAFRPGSFREGLTTPVSTIFVMKSPKFRPGMTVTHEGQPAEIVGVNGDHVIVTYTRRHQLRGGEWIGKTNIAGPTPKAEHVSPVSKAGLVSENFKFFVQQDTELLPD